MVYLNLQNSVEHLRTKIAEEMGIAKDVNRITSNHDVSA